MGGERDRIGRVGGPLVLGGLRGLGVLTGVWSLEVRHIFFYLYSFFDLLFLVCNTSCRVFKHLVLSISRPLEQYGNVHWFCRGQARMTRSHVLLHCPNAKLRAAREETWEGKESGGVRVLLANPRWERQFLKFLELSGVGRAAQDGTDEDGARGARLDGWIVWEAEEGVAN